MNPAFQTTEQYAPSSSLPAQSGGETPHGWISHTLRHLEGWVAWSIAVCTAWLAVLSFATLQHGSSQPLGHTLAQAGFLCIFPLLLAMRFGLGMRRPDDALESGRIDTGTALYNKAGLLALGDQLLAQSRAGRRPLAVAVFDCADLLEVRSIYGNKIARKLMARIVHKVSQVAGQRGLAARTGPAEFTVVLPGMTREKAIAAVERVLGRPARIEFDAGDSEIVLIPGFAMEVAGPDTESLEQLYQQLRDGLAKTEEDERRRQHHMQRERERHSRPMGITALADHQLPKAKRPVRIPLSVTQPAPLMS